MDQPPRRILLKITALTFALGATGCYVWQAQVKQAIRHVSGTKRPNYIMDVDTKPRISGTKSITQPVFSTRKPNGQGWLFPESVMPRPASAPALTPRKQPLDYPGYPPPAAGEVEVGGEIFTSTKSGVPLIKVQPSKP